MKKKLGAVICGMVLAGAGADAGTLEVDRGRSRIHVDAKATGHSFSGTLENYSVEVEGDGGTLEPASFRLKWKFADLKTGDGKRDTEMMKWLGGGGPEGSFNFTGTWTDGGTTYVKGDLGIHGVSKAIQFPYTAKREGEWVTIDGTATLDYRDFGLPLIRSMAVMTVNPKLSVRFHLVGKLKG